MELTHYEGVFKGYYIEIKEIDDLIWYYNFPEDNISDILKDYFQLEIDFE